jgi:hypothetical protein
MGAGPRFTSLATETNSPLSPSIQKVSCVGFRADRLPVRRVNLEVFDGFAFDGRLITAFVNGMAHEINHIIKSQIETGKRDAVGPKSGVQVAQSRNAKWLSGDL